MCACVLVHVCVCVYPKTYQHPQIAPRALWVAEDLGLQQLETLRPRCASTIRSLKSQVLFLEPVVGPLSRSGPLPELCWYKGHDHSIPSSKSTGTAPRNSQACCPSEQNRGFGVVFDFQWAWLALFIWYFEKRQGPKSYPKALNSGSGFYLCIYTHI